MRRSVFWLLDHYPELGESLACLHQHTLEQAELADRLGFHSLWLAEHHFRRLGTAANPAVLLAAIAQRTQSLRLGPAVSVLPLRNPIQVAEDYALVDSLSGGRLNMGVGAGSEAIEFAGMGCDYGQRKERFEQSLAILVDQWQTATAKNSTEASAGAAPGEINVAPVQSPCPPIYVATMQEESAHDIGRRGYSLLTLVSPFAQQPRRPGRPPRRTSARTARRGPRGRVGREHRDGVHSCRRYACRPRKRSRLRLWLDCSRP